jgi:glycosyltransferase involved in cell wall biosynthesis
MTQEKNKRKLLIISDAPSSSTGLGRICRDLTTRIHANLSDVFELATAGYGSPGSSKFRWPQFNLEGMSDWLLPTLPEIVQDFFGKEKGIILTIWDPHRLTWLASPEGCSELFTKFPGLQWWAMSRPFELWGYIPIDSSGPNDRLTFPIMKTLLGFDRLLAYGQFGEGVIRRTIGDENADQRHLTFLPHGIDGDTFYEISRKLSRKLFLEYTGAHVFFEMHRMRDGEGNLIKTAPIADDEVLIGCVATNQYRKDWALACETIALLSSRNKVRFWIHTDDLERYWSLPNLLVDYGILDKTVISLGQIPDEQMATAYSACDLTIGPGSEGFGYPLAESLACGTPVVTGSYAGAADFVPRQMQDDPIAFRYEGSYASKRPVYSAQDWANMAEQWIGKRTMLNPSYDWKQNWEAWEKWFRKEL